MDTERVELGDMVAADLVCANEELYLWEESGTHNTSKHLNETCGRSNQGLADATTEQWEEVGHISMKRGQGRVTPLSAGNSASYG